MSRVQVPHVAPFTPHFIAYKMKCCRYPKCISKLGPTNKSGLCKKHNRYTGNCKKCDKLCYGGKRYCYRCSHIFKSWRSKIIVLCQANGCSKITKSKSKLCKHHFNNAHKCSAFGCEIRIRFTSKYMLCNTHRGFAKKLKAENIDPIIWSPVPITRKRLPKNQRTSGGRRTK